MFRIATDLLLLMALAAPLGACATAGLEVSQERQAHAEKFSTLAVLPFENGTGGEIPPGAGDEVAGGVIAVIQEKHPYRFTDVHSTETRQPGELVVRDSILAFDPGSKAARFILIGLGAGDLKLEVTVVDAASDSELEKFATDGAIIAGGVMGATMGMEDMIKSAAMKIAERVAAYGSGSPATPGK